LNLRDELKSAVLHICTHKSDSYTFDELALEVFRFQSVHNPIYRQYLGYLRINPQKINRIDKIPFLPIQFFKNHRIISDNAPTQLTFESSGTTGRHSAVQITSKHHLSDLPFYELISQQIFEQFYGYLSDYHILALLPSYLERNNSSLVYMVQSFIYKSYSQQSGFYLNNQDELVEKLKQILDNQQDKRKILLIGVTFGLLDLVEGDFDFSFLRNHQDRLIVMETGGMKGRRKELLREEVHEILTKKLFANQIHSEYGMTELLSQGYSKGDGVFELPNTMKILLRDVNDPLAPPKASPMGSTFTRGGLNVIDLANIDSCCFIETQDLGNIIDNQRFTVIGRFDNSDIRGCNLMVI
jgi:hypothetical protein